MISLLTLAACLLPLSAAAPAEKRQSSGPVVVLDSGVVFGTTSPTGIDSFKGIPYAQPPVGPLRLKPPQPITKNLGVINAVGVPNACPQMTTPLNTSALPVDVASSLQANAFLATAQGQSEDCLTINVQRPTFANSTTKLPVLFWIYGGGFESGSTQMYDGSEFISSSQAEGKDFIYVAVNYRLGGFGWLAGKELLKDGSTNLGLLDQRLGLQWVADNIANFGGDPSKVTIWGESAGSISVFDQMALYDGNYLYKGKPLFRAAIMDSGSLVPADPVDGVKGQAIYDTVVQRAGCSGSADTLTCLRTVSYNTFLTAVNSVPGIFSYESVALSYLPRPDGKVLTQSPELLAMAGKYAPVPFIIGDQEDEGTLFSLVQSNISTTDQIIDYLKAYYFFDVTRQQVSDLVNLYPDDPSAGSPFRTGPLNNIYPQFKRIAAILGDLTFTLTRRVFLHTAKFAKPNVPSWSYLATYNYGTPVLGTFHASDILPAYGITPGVPSSTIQGYYSNFLVNLDPNVGKTVAPLPTWDKWADDTRSIINFGALGNSQLLDTFREDAYQYLLANSTQFHI